MRGSVHFEVVRAKNSIPPHSDAVICPSKHSVSDWANALANQDCTAMQKVCPKIHCLGWIVDRCYAGSRLVSKVMICSYIARMAHEVASCSAHFLQSHFLHKIDMFFV